jgi:ATP-dependent RNA helicase DDX47/RRP3
LELFLRIEAALQMKMEQYNVEKDQVLLLQEHVGEAQREAILKMKSLHEKRGPKGKGGGKNAWGVKGGKIEKKSRGEMDREEV